MRTARAATPASSLVTGLLITELLSWQFLGVLASERIFCTWELTSERNRGDIEVSANARR
jgi:hypothetical protein